jgi:hypothetical protein
MKCKHCGKDVVLREWNGKTIFAHEGGSDNEAPGACGTHWIEILPMGVLMVTDEIPYQNDAKNASKNALFLHQMA